MVGKMTVCRLTDDNYDGPARSRSEQFPRDNYRTSFTLKPDPTCMSTSTSIEDDCIWTMVLTIVYTVGDVMYIIT